MIRRVIFWALSTLALYYALFGGEYSAFDVREIRVETREARAELKELREAVDSLRSRADSLEHDPRALEILARERFGMIRDGETLYRFADREDEPEYDLP